MEISVSYGDPYHSTEDSEVEVTVSVSADGETYTLSGSNPVRSCRFQVIYAYGMDRNDQETMEIRTSGDYIGRLAGLCGNCNGDVADDFRDNNGNVQEDTDEGRRSIASSYAI